MHHAVISDAEKLATYIIMTAWTFVKIVNRLKNIYHITICKIYSSFIIRIKFLWEYNEKFKFCFLLHCLWLLISYKFQLYEFVVHEKLNRRSLIGTWRELFTLFIGKLNFFMSSIFCGFQNEDKPYMNFMHY